MTRSTHPIGILAIALLTAAWPQSAGAFELSELVDRPSRYVAALGAELTVVVADERYHQTWQARDGEPVERVIESEFVLVGVGDRAEAVGFRDVTAVDGRSVRDRQQRLQQLFLQRGPRSLERARIIADESARYNLGPIHRNFNVSTAALFFLHPTNRPRFAFTIDRGVSQTDTLWTVRYDERLAPTLVRTPEGKNVPARGRHWIEPGSGRVTRTQLWLNTLDQDAGQQIEVNVAVDYARDPGLGLWVPVEMREHYTAVDGSRLVTTAVYTNYRRFRVNARMRTPP